ncbi:hypothetical protein EVAR_66185_1 [Eumeta japonica]|uniref:Uncharacterized protein n=1 Tax=Eumeta variegata TaxID=151549 RepID=A0A4C1ZPW3_EUMVA|nr:hypothetical protein EVAR_66185_1 [Eumeta japonica]
MSTAINIHHRVDVTGLLHGLWWCATLFIIHFYMISVAATSYSISEVMTKLNLAVQKILPKRNDENVLLVGNDNELFCGTLKRIEDAYNDLCNCCSALNDVFGFSVLIIISAAFVYNLVIVYLISRFITFSVKGLRRIYEHTATRDCILRHDDDGHTEYIPATFHDVNTAVCKTSRTKEVRPSDLCKDAPRCPDEPNKEAFIDARWMTGHVGHPRPRQPHMPADAHVPDKGTVAYIRTARTRSTLLMFNSRPIRQCYVNAFVQYTF